MKWYMRYSGSLVSALERSGRARALSVLRSMDPRLLRETGFSPALMQQGLKAWPWRAQASNPPKATSVQAGSLDGMSEASRVAFGNPVKLSPGRTDSSDVPVIPGRVDNEAAA